MNNKGSIPAYVNIGASVIMSLVGFIFLSTTTSQQKQIDNLASRQVEDEIIISKLNEADLNTKDSLKRIEDKLDKVLTITKK